eukprot:s4583_g8.t1
MLGPPVGGDDNGGLGYLCLIDPVVNPGQEGSWGVGYVCCGMAWCDCGLYCGCEQSFFARVARLAQRGGQPSLCLLSMWTVPHEVWHAGSGATAETGYLVGVVPLCGVPGVGAGSHGDLALWRACAALRRGLDLAVALHGW